MPDSRCRPASTFDAPGDSAPFWALSTGILEIAAAVRLRAYIRGEWLLATGGVLSMLFGVLPVVWPGASALALIWLIGAYAILFGLLLLTLSFRLRQWGRTASSLPAQSR